MSQVVDPCGLARAWRRAGETGPPVDLYETADLVIIRLAVPGAEGGSLSLVIEDESVTIRGETAPPGARWSEATVVHWQEIPYGRFERRVPLPVPVQRDTSRAAFKNGVLEIALPKQQARQARTVQINIS
jgi:HSP20 family protein